MVVADRDLRRRAGQTLDLDGRARMVGAALAEAAEQARAPTSNAVSGDGAAGVEVVRTTAGRERRHAGEACHKARCRRIGVRAVTELTFGATAEAGTVPSVSVAEVIDRVKADAPSSRDEPHKAERVAAQPAMVAPGCSRLSMSYRERRHVDRRRS